MPSMAVSAGLQIANAPAACAKALRRGPSRPALAGTARRACIRSFGT
jgi:hypothetical protein